MKIIHTSDWHLGQKFMSRDRKAEHGAFLDWLLLQLAREKVDALVIAGDIFDTGTPPNYALEMYYRFLTQVRSHGCLNVIVVGGNHDSISTLQAPKALLGAINVRVVGGMSETMQDEVVVIRDEQGQAKGIVCAVPFLRERDLRRSVAGETWEDKSKALMQGIKDHYQQVCALARETRGRISNGDSLPIMATGHLFTTGGLTSDGVRDIYVGSLGQISADSFPEDFNYVALGHLHRPQKVGGREHIRYCGSPIPLSFSEAGTEKQILLVDLELPQVDVTSIAVPEFGKLCVIRGDRDEILSQVESLECPENGTIWLEVQYKGEHFISDFDRELREKIGDKSIELFALKNASPQRKLDLVTEEETEYLDDLSTEEIFTRRLDSANVREEEREELLQAFNEIMNKINDNEDDLL